MITFVLRWWVPLALVAWSFVVALPAGGTTDRTCTTRARCHRTVAADRQLRAFTTRETVPASDTAEIRVWVHGKPLPVMADGLRAAFVGDGVIVSVRAQAARGPLEFRYAATRPTRVRVAYWSHP